MQLIKKYKTVIFDCDGVILDSNSLKTSAMREALAGNPEDLVEEFIAYHSKNGGISRYVKFEHYFTKIRKVTDTRKCIEDAIEKYAKICKANLANSKVVNGLVRMLSYLHESGAAMFVVSGGEESEVKYAMEKNNLSKFFVSIHGSPTTKSAHIKNLFLANKIESPTLFFGDALQDMQVAENNGFDFVYISAHSDWIDGRKICKANGHQIVEDFSEIDINNIEKVSA